jgi:hypothetical protein
MVELTLVLVTIREVQNAEPTLFALVPISFVLMASEEEVPAKAMEHVVLEHAIVLLTVLVIVNSTSLLHVGIDFALVDVPILVGDAVNGELLITVNQLFLNFGIQSIGLVSCLICELIAIGGFKFLVLLGIELCLLVYVFPVIPAKNIIPEVVQLLLE